MHYSTSSSRRRLKCAVSRRTLTVVCLWAIQATAAAWLSSTAPFSLPGIRVSSHNRRHNSLLLQSSSNLPAISEDSRKTSTVQPLDDFHPLRFGGIGRLYGTSSQPADAVLARLHNATIAIVGVGGIGSWAAEALARSGIGNIVLIDADDICVTNTNRQVHALSTTIGQLKTTVLQQRLLQINPSCNVTIIHDFVSPTNVHEILQQPQHQRQWTMVLDAMDGTRDKAALLAACVDLTIPVVTCGGAAGRTDPTCIRVEDLALVEGDKLLATTRKELRKHYGFSQGFSFQERQRMQRRTKKFHIQAVYSLEPQQQPATVNNNNSAAAGASWRPCDSAFGTACFLTGTYGFVAAKHVVDMVIQNTVRPPRR